MEDLPKCKNLKDKKHTDVFDCVGNRANDAMIFEMKINKVSSGKIQILNIVTKYILLWHGLGLLFDWTCNLFTDI